VRVERSAATPLRSLRRDRAVSRPCLLRVIHPCNPLGSRALSRVVTRVAIPALFRPRSRPSNLRVSQVASLQVNRVHCRLGSRQVNRVGNRVDSRQVNRAVYQVYSRAEIHRRSPVVSLRVCQVVNLARSRAVVPAHYLAVSRPVNPHRNLLIFHRVSPHPSLLSSPPATRVASRAPYRLSLQRPHQAANLLRNRRVNHLRSLQSWALLWFVRSWSVCRDAGCPKITIPCSRPTRTTRVCS
jgi:hypothetical protein